MNCFECGNCQDKHTMYYCTAKNDFVIPEELSVREKTRGGWKKGNPSYEEQRKKDRVKKEGLEKIG